MPIRTWEFEPLLPPAEYAAAAETGEDFAGAAKPFHTLALALRGEGAVA